MTLATTDGREPRADAAREPRTRVNRQIRISPVRLVGADGEQVGVVPIEEAIRTLKFATERKMVQRALAVLSARNPQPKRPEITKEP